MKTASPLAALTLGLLLAWSPLTEANEPPPSPAPNGTNVQNVLSKLHEMGVRNVGSIHLQDGLWRVSLLDAGQIVTLEIDPTTLKVVSPEPMRLERRWEVSTDGKPYEPAHSDNAVKESTSWIENLEYTEGQIKVGPEEQIRATEERIRPNPIDGKDVTIE